MREVASSYRFCGGESTSTRDSTDLKQKPTRMSVSSLARTNRLILLQLTATLFIESDSKKYTSPPTTLARSKSSTSEPNASIVTHRQTLENQHLPDRTRLKTASGAASWPQGSTIWLTSRPVRTRNPKTIRMTLRVPRSLSPVLSPREAGFDAKQYKLFSIDAIQKQSDAANNAAGVPQRANLVVRNCNQAW